jgi:hypothetical protein
MNIQSKINLVDNLIFQSANFRIVVCSNNHQWIIQKRFGKSISEQGWQSISYHRSKDSLVRVYNEKTGDAMGASVLDKMLPSHFGGDS